MMCAIPSGREDRMNWIQFFLIMVTIVVGFGLLVALDDYRVYWDLQRRLSKEKERIQRHNRNE